MNRANKEALELHQAYSRVFSSEDGKRVLEDMKKRSRYKTSTFDINPNVTAYNEGWRSFLCYVLDRMDIEKHKSLVK